MPDGILSILKMASLWLLVSLLAGHTSALVYPLFARFIARVKPQTRAAARWSFGLLTPLSAALVVLLLMNPVLAGLLVPQHCHEGVCGSHTPVYAASAVSLSLVALSSFVLLALIAALASGVRRAGRRLGALNALARSTGGNGYRVVETPDLLAWCGGLWRPRILVSRGLLERLEGPQLQAVLAHEKAHAERMDNLRALLLHGATMAWPGRKKRAIARELASDTEQACDQQAARVVGSTGLVAAALTTLEAYAAMPQHSMAFGAEDSTARLQALAMPAHHYAHPLRAWLAVAVQWLLLVIFLTGLSHLAVEWLTAATH